MGSEFCVMPSFAILSAFIVTSVLFILAPGPDILFVMAQGITNSRRAGFFTAMGLALGNGVHILGVVTGVTLLLKTIPPVFIVFKILGALYLFYLAYKILREHNNSSGKVSVSGSESIMKYVTRGLIMNLMNPKVSLFFLAFFPQFIDDQSNSPAFQMIFLGCIFLVLVTFIFGITGYHAGFVQRFFVGRPTYGRVLHLISAILFVGIGIHLLLMEI